MAKQTYENRSNFPIITKGENFTRVGDAVIFQVKGHLWRYKADGPDGKIKIDFVSRVGAVTYAVYLAINENANLVRSLDDKLSKHKIDAMFHKHHYKEAVKRHDEDQICIFQTRIRTKHI